MINPMQRAVIKKDMLGIAANKRLLTALLIVPLTIVIVLPSVFILIMHFVPDGMEDFQTMLALVPGGVGQENMTAVMIDLVMNRIMPIFFLIIPIMAASVMAASSFVGEKEKRTLETLLYSPLSLRQLFQAKVLASLLMSFLVSLVSFLAMVLVIELETKLTSGIFFLPDLNWLLILLLVSPAISCIAITLIVRGSAKAQTIEESQQRAVFLIMPVLVLLVGQFMGLIFIDAWMLLVLGAVCAVLALLLLRRSLGGFDYEALLK